MALLPFDYSLFTFARGYFPRSFAFFRGEYRARKLDESYKLVYNYKKSN